ncbi:hypothetical protein QQF64_011279 [Cirrhinus molitorella]|uniref:Uncharacterized protein n=1 Tax=Cirrhinus molitorella TaxID=172907 RepID=A0ABR3LYS1_9TELE
MRNPITIAELVEVVEFAEALLARNVGERGVLAPQRMMGRPLIPLPIIEMPFERIGMDLVGSLPGATNTSSS